MRPYLIILLPHPDSIEKMDRKNKKNNGKEKEVFIPNKRRSKTTWALKPCLTTFGSHSPKNLETLLQKVESE